MAQPVSGSARWSWRLTVIGLAAFVLGPVLAHLWIAPAMLGFLLFALGGFLASIAFLLSLVAFVINSGESRTAALWGILVAGICTSVFVFAAIPGRDYPRINDIATDLQTPPQFMAVLRLPANEGRDMSYPGEEFAAQQREGYPELGPVVLGEDPAAAYRRVVATARSMPGWEIHRTDENARVVEGTDTTWMFRFQDDFVIEVRPADGGSAVHMRSKSRDGRGDIGANAKRIRAFFEALKNE